MSNPQTPIPDWVQKLLDLGIGNMAIYFLDKYEKGRVSPRTCPRCGYTSAKFSKKCPNCRLDLIWVT